MAALSERDLRAILGDNYKEKLNAAAAERGITDEHRQLKVARDEMADSTFMGKAAMFIGIALLVTGYINHEPTFWIQAIVAAVIFAAGLAWIFNVNRRLKQIDIRLAEMTRLGLT